MMVAAGPQTEIVVEGYNHQSSWCMVVIIGAAAHLSYTCEAHLEAYISLDEMQHLVHLSRFEGAANRHILLHCPLSIQR